MAADCGAGVGRVTEQLLLDIFDEVDLLEPSKHLLATATERCTAAAAAGHKLGNAFCMGLQQWTPAEQRWENLNCKDPVMPTS